MTAEPPPSGTDLVALRRLIRRLRAPDGCPWDRERRLEDLRAYLLEEAHEVAAAIDDEATAEIREELGDLLFQVVFVAELADERADDTLDRAIAGVHRKMVERHPHVFGSERLADAGAVHRAWERRKSADKPTRSSHLDGVPASLPALAATHRMTQKASGVGFDWPHAAAVIDKVREELAELEEALAEPVGDRRDRRLREELGDLLFAAANLGRHLGIDPEAALAQGNRKFRRRFQEMEERLAGAGVDLAQASLEEMESAWQEVKSRERSAPPRADR